MSRKREYKSYKRGDVVYVDLGNYSPGAERGLRPCIVVSRNAGNHERTLQVTVVPLTTTHKEIPVHVEVKPLEVTGYHLKETSMALAESIQSVQKSRIRGKIGCVDADSGVMDRLDAAVKLHLGLFETEC